MIQPDSSLEKCYQYAKKHIIQSGFINEILWQERVKFEDVSQKTFLKECAWVILCSGFHERVVRGCFQDISLCFFEWESTEKILEYKEYCIEFSLRHFNNHRKINAIAEAVEVVSNTGFEKLKSDLINSPIQTLQTFPFIGPITSYHLAKNLGLSFAKADRHLLRISKYFGYECVQDFCLHISAMTGDAIQVVDIVLWRFANLSSDYLKKFDVCLKR